MQQRNWEWPRGSAGAAGASCLACGRGSAGQPPWLNGFGGCFAWSHGSGVRRMVTNDGKKHRFSCPIRRGLGRGASIGMPTYANPPRGGVSQSLYQQSTCSCCTFLFDFFKLPNYSQGPDRLKGPSLPQAPHVSDPRRDPTRETRSSQCGPAAELELFGHPKLKNGLHGVRIK